MRVFIRMLAAVIIGIGLSGCNDGISFMPSGTSQENKKPDSGPIVIGVLSSPHNHDSLLRGIHLALKEINDRPAFRNQPLQVNAYLLPGSHNYELDIVQKIIGTGRILAVINGLNSPYTAATDRTLLIHKILHIMVANTSLSVSQASPLSFRIISNDRISSRQLVARLEWTWRNMAVINESSDWVLLRTKSFIEAAAESGVHFPQSISYFPWEKDIRQLLWNLREEINRNHDFLDAIYIACGASDMASIIHQIRAMNIHAPIISSVDLTDITQLQEAGNAANGVLMASYFNPDATDPAVKDFVKRFHEAYPKHQPDIWAARAYDGLSMLAASVERAKTLDAWDIASEMLLRENWDGATGRIVFGISGDVQEHGPFYLKQYCNGRFIFLTENQPIPFCPPGP